MNTRSLLVALAAAGALLAGVACRTDAPAPPARLGHVRAHLPKEPRRLFPLVAASSYETQVNDLVYQYLLHFDPTTGRLAPQLAEAAPEIRVDEEGRTRYRFRLRAGAAWSDGRPVSVDDVVFTYKAIFFPGLASSPLRAGVRELVDIDRVGDDPRGFEIVVAADNLNGAAYYGNVPILPEHVYDPERALREVSIPRLLAAGGPDELPAATRGFADPERTAAFGKTTVVGSGPYRFDAWEPGRSIRLVRDRDFWGRDFRGGLFLAGPDTIEFVPVPDQQAALAMLRNGDLDVVANVPPREAVAMRDDPDDGIDVHTPLQLTRTFVYLNTRDSLLADRDTRRGLAHLLDVEGFLRDVQLGFGRRLDGPYHPDQEYARIGDYPVAFSPDSARAALARAGWTDADGDGLLDRERADGRRETLELEYLYPAASSSSEALALLFAADARRAGVRVVPVGKEYGALLGDLARRDFQLVQGALGGEPLPDDPYGLWHTGADTPRGKNRAGFGDAATDALIDSIRVNLDPVTRTSQYARLARRIAEEQPVVFLIVPRERIAVRAGLNPVTTARRPGYYLPGFTGSRLGAAGASTARVSESRAR